QWQVATPFDNTKDVGFKTAYPPEQGVDLKATYKGKGDKEVKWVPVATADPFGRVDLNLATDKHKGAVAYAFAQVDSPPDQEIEVRVGSVTGVKVFVNGKEVFAREEYHHGMRFDQYSAKAKLKKGRNEILLKVCQNEQEEDWAQNWLFQARLCNSTGVAVPFTQETVPAKAATPTAADQKPPQRAEPRSGGSTQTRRARWGRLRSPGG